MNASTVLLLLLVLACPLGMAFMMRGGQGHGHGGLDHPSNDHDHGDAHEPLMRERSTAGLRELRDELDQMIEERELLERAQSEDEVATGAKR